MGSGPPLDWGWGVEVLCGEQGLHAPATLMDLEMFMSILFARMLPHSWYAFVPGWSPSGNIFVFSFETRSWFKHNGITKKGVIILLLMMCPLMMTSHLSAPNLVILPFFHWDATSRFLAWCADSRCPIDPASRTWASSLSPTDVPTHDSLADGPTHDAHSPQRIAPRYPHPLSRWCAHSQFPRWYAHLSCSLFSKDHTGESLPQDSLSPSQTTPRDT